MKHTLTKSEQRERRHNRIRAKVNGTPDMPRLSVYKSNKYIYAQLIDDERGATLVAASTAGISSGTMLEKAKAAGALIAKAALSKKIKKVVFDRGGFIYTGRIKAFADGARGGGLTF